MKKYFLVIVLTLTLCFVIMSPSVISRAEYLGTQIGNVIIDLGNNSYEVYDLYVLSPPSITAISYTTSGGVRWFTVNGNNAKKIIKGRDGTNYGQLNSGQPFWAYVAGSFEDTSFIVNNNNCRFYSNVDNFNNAIPEQFKPAPPSIAEQRWDAFYEWYKNEFGFYPIEGSLIDLLRSLALGDEDANTEIIFPTLTPAPSPTPTPTPIPVQTIFVPDGNGNTTIVYQYPDPTTGVITQSPYNPNIENNITVSCDCNGSGSSGNNTFGTNPQDPYTLTSSMLWADGFGVEISDNPLTAANDSQQTLAAAASEYADSVNVASNSFNILPVKWLTLVGLLGGILIIAGLIRTFLGG